MHRAILALAALTLTASTVDAQARAADHEWCGEGWYGDRDRDRYCEVRELTLPAHAELRVDGRDNGGITVRGWDRNEIHIEAKVQASADTESAARSLVSEVRLEADGIVRATGPRAGRHEHWAVSYRIHVPRETNLSLETHNGGIGIYDVSGQIDFRATNGGVHLEGLAGNVRGRTTNGGLDVQLTGSEWRGEGLDVMTTNGGVKLTIPDGYSARLETGTTNGGFQIDFPITVQGRIDRRHLTTDLGRGGQLIRAVTTNGGVVVRKG